MVDVNVPSETVKVRLRDGGRTCACPFASVCAPAPLTTSDATPDRKGRQGSWPRTWTTAGTSTSRPARPSRAPAKRGYREARIGPYNTREEAERGLAELHERNKRMDEEDLAVEEDS